MSEIMDALQVEGWGEFSYFGADGECSESEALRRELWVVAGDSYIYQCRGKPTADSPWGRYLMGEQDDKEVTSLKEILDVLVDFYSVDDLLKRDLESSASLHPVLYRMLVELSGPIKKHTLTWDDLTDEAKAKVLNTERAMRLMDEAAAILLSRDLHIYDEERNAIYAGRVAAGTIADRQAALALRSLRTVTEVEDGS